VPDEAGALSYFVTFINHVKLFIGSVFGVVL